jgi:hypothetical protein
MPTVRLEVMFVWKILGDVWEVHMWYIDRYAYASYQEAGQLSMLSSR